MEGYTGTKAKLLVLRTDSETPYFERHTFRFESESAFDDWISSVLTIRNGVEHIKDGNVF